MTNRIRIQWLSTFCALAVAGFAGSKAWAVQHLISPGSDWSNLEERIRPGDEVILMPGRHRDVAFKVLNGTKDKPITIRGLTKDQPSVIEAGREGIRIDSPSHLVIRDLNINDATLHALVLGVEAKSDDVPQSNGMNIRLTNISISNVGAKGERHGILLSRMKQVRIKDCRFDGWGGSAIEMVGCKDMSIEGCLLSGRETHEQKCGIRARAGCDRIRIHSCRFENAGDFVVCIGGTSKLDDFAPTIQDDAVSGSITEVVRMQVEQCVFVGGKCPVAFFHADDCLARNNTIIRPRFYTFGMFSEHTDSRFTTGKRNIFGQNIVTWEPGDLEELIHVSKESNSKGLILEENIWWSSDMSTVQEQLQPLVGDNVMFQKTDLDPQLDESHRPSEPLAKGFGAG